MALEPGYVEPLRPLRDAGQQLWDQVFARGEIWISGRTDTPLLQMVCEQVDRRADLVHQLQADQHDRSLQMSINDLEKLISSNLGLLGLSPSDRSRLGVAEVKAGSQLEEMIQRARAHWESAERH